ncbi:MFS transporter, partial [Streptomyces tendae]
ALRGVFGVHALRASFASGLNAAAVAAGAVAAVAGVLVLVLVRPERGFRVAGVTDSAPPALKEEEAAPVAPYRR